jgi:hypothetical protein
LIIDNRTFFVGVAGWAKAHCGNADQRSQQPVTYRKDVRPVGFESPDTWDELAQAARTIKEKTGGDLNDLNCLSRHIPRAGRPTGADAVAIAAEMVAAAARSKIAYQNRPIARKSSLGGIPRSRHRPSSE